MMLKAPVVVVCGHYGVGKTNFALNLAHDARAAGCAVTLVDLDVVNPYFRSSDYAKELAACGVRVIAPVFAALGTSLDVPSLTGAIVPAIEEAQQAIRTDASAEFPSRMVIIDAGGDDAGASALGRFSSAISVGAYEMLYVVNERRNLTYTPAEAISILREIEAKSNLHATAVVNNTHLQKETDASVVERGISFARQTALQAGLPLACTTVPPGVQGFAQCRKDSSVGQKRAKQEFYPVRIYVRTPWDV